MITDLSDFSGTLLSMTIEMDLSRLALCTISGLAPLSMISVESGTVAPLFYAMSDLSELPLSVISDSSVEPTFINSDAARARRAPLFT